MHDIPARTRITRRAALALIPAALAAPALARGAPGVQVLDGRAFGTGWRVTLPDTARAADLGPRIAALLTGIDAHMSPWRAETEIGGFNGSVAPSLALSVDTAAVTAAALSIAGQSGGRFDPTVGPLVGRWGFGPIRGETPGDGWRRLELDGVRLSRRDPRATLDLCGIAKGFALDRIAALLDGAGTRDLLIDLGGELTARGRHPSGRDWHVAVEDPREGAAGAAEVLRLDGLAVATSGDRVNAYMLGGRRYSHIIDPAARQPVAGTLASVTVVAADGMTADGWATALFAAGAADGPALARAQGIDALFLMRDGAGLARIATPGFARHLAQA